MAKNDGELIGRNLECELQQFADFVDQPSEILAGADAADRSGEDVIEQQSRNGKARDERSHRVTYDDVHTAAYKHAAAFHVDRAHGETEQHDAKDEPWSASADRLLGDAAGVINARSQITEYNGGRTPERNEREHDSAGDNYGCRADALLRLGYVRFFLHLTRIT